MNTLDELLDRQSGLVTRHQLLAVGISRHAITAQLRARRWQRVYDGVYATFTGSLTWPQRVSAAILHAGEGACASHGTAAALYGFSATVPNVCLTIPAHRRICARPGVHVARSTRLGPAEVHWEGWPPRTRVERTVLDLVDGSRTPERAFSWLAAACGGRYTTPPRLLTRVQYWPELRWRATVIPALSDIAAGVHSNLELLHRRIEERHGLPLSRRQVRERHAAGARWLDCDYWPLRVRVELDGRLGHDQPQEIWRDYRRDNDGVVSGQAVLRYGWVDLSAYGCRVAGQTADVLHRAGWQGSVRACGPRCAIPSRTLWSA